eukprot:918235-Rhodomonas_salina.1
MNALLSGSIVNHDGQRASDHRSWHNEYHGHYLTRATRPAQDATVKSSRTPRSQSCMRADSPARQPPTVKQHNIGAPATSRGSAKRDF